MSRITGRVPRGVLVVAAWGLAVAVGSASAWYAVDRAGQAVTRTDGAPAQTGPSSSSPSGASRSPSDGPTGTGTASPTPEPTDAATSGATSTRPTDGGTVAVSCTGQAAALVYATPAAGWSVEVRDSGPDRVRVRFELRGDGEEREVDVRAECPAGRPVFAVERS
jgi:hypothetical protein